jgi:tRNA-specific 2-thiouridylase
MRLGSVGDVFDEPLPAEGRAATTRTPRSSEAAAARSGASLRIHHRGCCSVGDAMDARQVAGALGIPLYVVNFRREFSRVIDYFVGEYDAGRTPNPCVRCNDWLKFGRLFDCAAQLGASHVATGHYARVSQESGASRLRRGIDAAKDQSYVLFGLRRDRLEQTLLPVGDLRKPQVRELARDLGLPVSEKPDSQEICFVPDDDYAGLVARRGAAGTREGLLVDDSGGVIGRHSGHQHFTIGQRRGLGVAAARPLYVVAKNAATNTVTVGPRESLQVAACTAMECNWLSDPPSEGAWRECGAQFRAHGEAFPARVCVHPDGSMEVRFENAVDAVAPGQAIVLYEGEVVLGGGWIDRTIRATDSASAQLTGASPS